MTLKKGKPTDNFRHYFCVEKVTRKTSKTNRTCGVHSPNLFSRLKLTQFVFSPSATLDPNIFLRLMYGEKNCAGLQSGDECGKNAFGMVRAKRNSDKKKKRRKKRASATIHHLTVTLNPSGLRRKFLGMVSCWGVSSTVLLTPQQEIIPVIFATSRPVGLILGLCRASSFIHNVYIDMIQLFCRRGFLTPHRIFIPKTKVPGGWGYDFFKAV